MHHFVSHRSLAMRLDHFTSSRARGTLNQTELQTEFMGDSLTRRT